MHFFREILALARRQLGGNTLRTVLTLLGIAIGIFAITAVFSIVNSIQYSLTKKLAELGNTVLYVHHWPWKDNSEDWFEYINRPKVDYSDFQVLYEELDNVEALAFEVNKRNLTLQHKGRSVEGVRLKGVTHDYLRVLQYGLEQGRWLTPREALSGAKVCLLGVNVFNKLFPTGRLPAEPLEVKGKRLRVVGVIQEQGDSPFGPKVDDMCIVSYPVFSSIYQVRGRRMDRVISVRAARHERVPAVEQQIIGLLRKHRGLKPGVDNNFSINKQESLIEQMDRIFVSLEIGGVFISLFSLLVGGFGISNIMFVSVKERTVEIGVQMALGAKRWFILGQFLAEAVLLCLLGGLVGIALLYAVVLSVGYFVAQLDLGFYVVLDYLDILTGLGIAVLLGIVSGLAPAWQASRLDPVEAMRSA